MKRRLVSVWIAILGLAAGFGLMAENSAAQRVREPIVGLPCEGCEAVFEGLPDSLSSAARIAAANEPGQAMRIEGTVFDRKGRPASGVIVYAYHTNAEGVYPPNKSFKGQSAYRHGLLRAWVKTDEQGRYRFETIRPASYPGTDDPAHVHMHVLEVGRCTYYIDDILFEDDPALTLAKRRDMVQGRGGIGVVKPRKDASGMWNVRRDIRLGEKIPGYPEDP